MKDLHLALPDHLAEEVDRLASDLGKPRNVIVRQALENYIAAEKMAGRSGEFVKETGAAVSRKILRENRW